MSRIMLAALAALLVPAASAHAEVVDRFPVPLTEQSVSVSGPVLDGDAGVLWGQGVDAAPGEGSRRRGESPGWLLRAALPGQAPRTLPHPPFPVVGRRQGLGLSAADGRMAVAVGTGTITKYGSYVSYGGSIQLGPFGGTLVATSCEGGRVHFAGPWTAHPSCGDLGRSWTVDGPGGRRVVETRSATAVDVGAGRLVVGTDEPRALHAVDLATGARSLLLDDGLRTVRVVIGDDGTVVAHRSLDPQGTTRGDRIDVLFADGGRSSISTTATPIAIHGDRIVLRDADRLLTLDARTSAERTVLALPPGALLGEDVGPRTLAWAQRDCDEVVVHRAPFDGSAVATPAVTHCPEVSVRPALGRLDRRGRLLLDIRCPEGCAGSVDAIGDLGVHARKDALRLPARRSAQRVALPFDRAGRRRIARNGSVGVAIRLRVTSAGVPVRRRNGVRLSKRAR